MTRRLTRRSLLAATGASSLLLPLLHQEQTFGQAGAFPLRLVFLIWGNGTIEDAFWPTGGEGSIVLPEISTPLEAHKDKLIFLQGIDQRVWAEDNPFGGNGDAHHNWGCILTGTTIATGDPPHDPGGPGLALASSKSIDLHIGEALNAQAEAAGQPTQTFPVLSVRARGSTGSGRGVLTWSGDRAPYDAEGDPVKLFDTLFAGVSPDMPDPALIKLRKKRQSVLDYVGTALERQTQKLGTEDRHKVQLHLDAVRNIEKQLAGGPLPVTCTPPTGPDDGFDFNDDNNLPVLVSTQMDLATAAMACGLTRVSTICIGDANDYDVYFPFLPISQVGIEFPTRHHHDIAHRPGENNADHIKVEQWYIQQLALLIDKLSAVPEGDGTMFDNTVVMAYNTLNSGFGHSVLGCPTIVAAGANTGIRTAGGRVMNLDHEAHNTLLCALSNHVGVPMDSWGDARYPGALDLT